MPCVKAFDMWSAGNTSVTFRGHSDYVKCCWFSLQDQELYTGGKHREILVWSPSRLITDEVNEKTAEDLDNSSD
ncbi:DNA excision repair protein ERCC-8-like [Quillaja saponaria]|uniref:DNA excision repair protein ERCC-8-like n=1 Tax=Quillaja saponaria TaxID=32244 RepID=A0AAD7VIK6_QUISA|nr:DNA excision repair protein ERCC-8-like [Quillaja saponaria]